MNSITEQQFYDLLSLKLSGDATAEDLVLLQQQLLLNPQWQFLYDQVMQPPVSLYNPVEHTGQAYAAHFVKMQLQGKFEPGHHSVTAAENDSTKKGIHRRFIYVAIAASIIGIIFFAKLIMPAVVSPEKSTALNEIVTKKGSKSTIKLPDGTQVWLNADSKLTYAENFIGKTREVTLTGEAYFDVTHDTLHPFIIHTGKANIKVLGTAFNVRNYPQDKSLETTLVRGKIEVWFADHPDEKIIMKPLEKLIVRKDSIPVNKSLSGNTAPGSAVDKIVLTEVTYGNNDSTVSETSWLDDKMVYVDQPLEKIAQELERSFDITITFKREEVRNYRYTGTFDNINLENVMQILHLSNKKLNYKIEDKNVIIY